jgi:hypothetical protein
MGFFSPRVFSGITLLAGSGVFWIGCGKSCKNLDKPFDFKYGLQCPPTDQTCEETGTIDEFDKVCQTECKTQEIGANEVNNYFGACISCTISTVYGTRCERDTTIDSETVFYTCSTLSTENPGGDVFTCTRKVCGLLFDKIYDCTTKKTVAAT